MLSELFVCISGGMSLLLHNLWDFIKKCGCFCFFYGQFAIIPTLFSLGFMALLKATGVTADIYSLLFKISLIVGQIIPAAGFAGVLKEDRSVEGSTDICFCGTIIAALLIWYVL